MGVIVRRDDGHGMEVKGKDGGGWSSDDVVLWLGRRQNRDAVEWWEEWPKLRWPFIVVEGGSQAVRRGCPAAVMQIQCFGFGSSGEVTEWSIAGRWSGDSELVLAPWVGSMTWCGGVATLARGEAALGREKGGDNASWADVNLTRPKIKENPRCRFNCSKWTVKI
jgi:hypothetical protein